MKKQKSVKLYHVLFPVWMLMLFPMAWLAILPGNFIVDSLVLLLGMVLFKIEDKSAFYKKHILKVFGFGMLSDFIGAGFIFLMMWGLNIGSMGDELYLTIPAIILTAVLIFVFNYYITFKDVDKSLRLKLSLLFAIVTAPYTFLIPTGWLY